MNKLFLLSVCACFLNKYITAADKVVICYYGTWATYRNGLGKFDVSNINIDLCTHIVYTFVGINSQGNVISLDTFLDYPDNWGRDNFGKFNALKLQNSKLKTILAVGGWNEASAKYSVMAANPTFRKNFVSSALAMVLQYGFDGLDVDWEYPNRRDSINGQADINNFTQLLKELREEFNKYGLLLTAAVSSVKASASLSYDIPSIVQYLDFVNVMTYDMNGAWDPKTGHNAPLHRSEGDENVVRDQLNTVDVALEYWLGQGCPPEKLVLGLPFYGHTFQLANVHNNGVGASANGPGLAGPYTSTSGTIGYNEFCQKLRTESWEQRYDKLAKVPYAVQGQNWVSYDDANSLVTKVDYALQFNISGVMVWSIETDDFHGICHTEDFPLLRAINRALGKTVVTTTTTTESTSTTATTTPVYTTTTVAPTSESTTTSLTFPPNSSGSTTMSTTSAPTIDPTENTFVCVEEGYYENPKDCTSFYVCIGGLYNNFESMLIQCPANLYWDQKNKYCNYPNEVDCNLI
ncbi:chitinase-3-like protein 1 [Nymphalis io]|uniref:chitinase-3-like protein 1 n=1 Tax=Inachis io TaxID=171585 RepID=UPI002167691B|nr:chitinase-3-like protein 1 [Nymphalis io]